MANPFISMIEAFGFNFAPRGWALCAGQTLPINQNQALFALLGTTFGGNGQTTFNLPDLRGRLALGFGQGAGLSSYNLGAAGGEEAHQLPTSEVPAHAHTLNANNNGQTNGTNIPSSTVLMGSAYGIEANNPQVNIYSNTTATLRRRLRWPRVRSAPPEEAARTKTGCRF